MYIDTLKRLKERLAIIRMDWLVGIFFGALDFIILASTKSFIKCHSSLARIKARDQTTNWPSYFWIFSLRSFGLFRGSLIEVIMKLTWFLVPLQINLIMIWLYRMGKRHQLWIQHHLNQKVLGLVKYGPFGSNDMVKNNIMLESVM